MSMYYKGRTVGNMIVNLPSFANVCEQKISFEDWHNGTTESTLVAFPHNLGAMPDYVAIVANDATAIIEADAPVSTKILQADRLRNGNTYYSNSYLRCAADGIVNAAIGTDTNKLIAKWDERFVYVNSISNAYAWAAADVSTYTLICAKNGNSGVVEPSIPASDICRTETIDVSFDRWIGRGEDELIEISHSLGVVPDMVLLLPSHYWSADEEPYLGESVPYQIMVKAVKTIDENSRIIENSQTYEIYFTESNEYVQQSSGGKSAYGIYSADEEKVTLLAGNGTPFAPSEYLNYKLLVIKHT